jgi:hypothetical protein
MGLSRRRTIAVRVAGLLTTLWVAACVAPTLPLPPPEPAPLSAPDADGMVTVGGQAQPGALVFVLNEDLQEGVITVADDVGTFETRIAARSGDTLSLWQRVGHDDGTAVALTVP